MGSLDEFSKTLSSPVRDDLAQVLQSMTDGVFAKRMSELDQELAAVVRKIDEVNRRREQFSAERAPLERLLSKIDEHISAQGTDLELTLFRLHLSNRLDRLKVRIAETRPDDDLKRKHDLTQEKQLLEAGRKVATEVLGRMAKAESVR